MAKRILTSIVQGMRNEPLKPKFQIYGGTLCRRLHTNEVPVKEIQIPIEWGHMAAKLWGSSQERPILAFHGWQDNAGTWDTLVPKLIQEMDGKRSVLAVDLPGHGLSTWIPPGMNYYAWEYPRLFLYLKEYFKWDKVSILAHSMGSIAGFRYASVFPDDVDFYIAIDSLIYDDFDLTFVVDKYPTILTKGMISQTRLDKEPPSHSWDETVNIWHLGTRKSVSKESVPYLMKRGTKPSKLDPNKYYFSRDPRLKHTLFNPEDKKFVEALAMRLKCPTLYIKAIDSPYASDAFSVGMRELIEKNHVDFESLFLPGTHHLHLNTPDILLPHIISFLKKYKFA